MPLGSTSMFACILPVEKTNLITNCSFERGTASWGTVQAGTVGSASDFQTFGAWSGSVAPTSNGTTGARSPTFTAGNGTDYTASAYIRGANGIPYRFGVGDSNGASMVGSMTFTGGGTWHRYSFSWTEPSGATRALAIKKDSSADTSAFYIDGVQVEVGSLTTFISGDEEGCTWLGAPHASQATRSGTYRGGGSVVALADLGLKPFQYPGIGMPPQEITSLSFALQPGAEYQRSRAAERPFVITFQPILGTTMQGFHVTRRTIIDAFKSDLVDPQQPIRFWYTGGQGTLAIDAVYAGGLELGEMNGPMAEEGAIKFVAHNPYWSFTTDQGTSLAVQTVLGSTNNIVKRDTLGRWGTLAAGTTTNGDIAEIAHRDGTIFIVGDFGSVAGTAAPFICAYFHEHNRFGTLTGGTVAVTGGLGGGSALTSVVAPPSGSVFFGGGVSQLAGTNTRMMGQWNSAGFGTLIGGTVETMVRDLVYSKFGTLFVAGDFVTAGGTTAWRVAQWVNAWGTLTNQGAAGAGSIDDRVLAMALGLDNRLFMGGRFGSAGGTAAVKIAQWFLGTFGTLTGGLTGVGALGPNDMTVGADGRLIAGGVFGSAGGATATNVASWNNVQWSPMGSGLRSIISSVFANQKTGEVYAGGGIGTVENIGFSGFIIMGLWNGYRWLPGDFLVPGVSNDIQSFALANDGAIYAAGGFSGIGTSAAVAQIVNYGRAESYPIVKWRNSGASNRRVYQLANTLTGAYIRFNMTLTPGEEVVFDTRSKTLQSSQRGNVFGDVLLPGSNLVGFSLMPGTNYISSWAEHADVATSIYWRPKSHSADGGTVY